MEQTTNDIASEKRLAYTPAEVARLFGRSTSWAYRRIYAGDFRVLKGGRILIPATEIQRMLAAAEVFSEYKTRQTGDRRLS